MVTLEQRHYERLLDFRTGLRRFLRWSADQAAMAGVTPTQHQLLLAIRGHPDPAGPTIREMAGYLLVRHHSAVELVDRAVAAGLVERRQDGDDLRAVRLCLTANGADRLARLSALHLEELRRFAPQLEALWDGLDMSCRSRRVGDLRTGVGLLGLVKFGQCPPNLGSDALEVGQCGHAGDRPEHEPEPEDGLHLLFLPDHSTGRIVPRCSIVARQ